MNLERHGSLSGPGLNRGDLGTKPPTGDRGAGETVPEPPGVPAPEVAPVEAGRRLQIIDVLRGVALLGILLMNIPGFAMPSYFDEAFRSNPGDPNYWLMAFISVFFEGKMRALFGMVFGAGVVLFTRKKEETGRPVTGLFYRRMAWLVLFGLIHAHVILWFGDILYLYGICGMLVYLLRNVKVRYLVLAVPLVAVLDFAGNTVMYQHVRKARLAYVDAARQRDAGVTLNAGQETALKDWREIEKTLIPNRADVAENTRKVKSDYATVASYVRPIAWEFQGKYLVFSVCDSLALMLFGVALFRAGFLTGDWAPSTYRLIAGLGYGLGLPLVSYSLYHRTLYNPNLEVSLQRLEAVPVEWVWAIYPFQRIFLVMAHVSLLVLLFKSGRVRGLLGRLAAVGQMAFTNYITHSLICTFVFFGYGLNFHAEVSYAGMYLIAVGIWALQLAYSPFWLQRFRFGPLEWLWRSLTYWKIQPFRRPAGGPG